jgi:hypothetical protein
VRFAETLPDGGKVAAMRVGDRAPPSTIGRSPTMSTRTTAAPTTLAAALTASGLLLAAGGFMHPQADADAGYEQALAGMFGASAWTASHALTLAGFLLLAGVLAGLLLRLGGGWSARQRIAGWAVVAAASLAAIESVPHLLASSESDALLRGDATAAHRRPRAAAGVSTPAFGLAVAALALATAGDRTLGNGRVAAAVATIGGLAFALAGPLMAITKDPALSPLFAGAPPWPSGSCSPAPARAGGCAGRP